MGNGFPVSAVVCKPEIEISDAMLIGSTFSNNPLLASAVAATLTEMRRLDMCELLAKLDRTVRSGLSSLEDHGVVLRGGGALWALELPDSRSALDVQAKALSANIVLSANGRYIRLLPPATISSANLDKALRVVSTACIETLAARSPIS
jgi:acetylornithine/succinyldiaminopimelate/putrescine aminotransferase